MLGSKSSMLADEAGLNAWDGRYCSYATADESVGAMSARTVLRCSDQAKTKYLRTVSTTSQVPFMPGSTTKISPALR